MIASVLTLGPRDIRHLDLTDGYTMHKIVYDLFPGSDRTFLYYQYPFAERRGVKILILSEDQPLVPAQGTIESKMVKESFLRYRYYAFKVRLNPVTRLGGKATPVTGHDPLISWFLEKQERWGFVADASGLDLSDVGVATIQKGKNRITLNQCTYTGVLEVVDQDRFIEGFENGLGRAKGFGFGLLQLKPLR